MNRVDTSMHWEHYVQKHTCSFSSLPQVGDYTVTAVKRGEQSWGWDAVMDNDSQHARGRAQPWALASSPGEAGETRSQVYTYT